MVGGFFADRRPSFDFRTRFQGAARMDADVELPVTAQASDSAVAAPQAASGVQMLDPRVVTLNRIVGSIVWGVFSLIHLLSIIVMFLTISQRPPHPRCVGFGPPAVQF